MQIKKKFTLEIIILSIILAITSFIIIDNTLNVEENFSILNDDLIPRLSLLKDMRLMASNVLISTLEFTMFEENFVTSDDTQSNANVHSSEILSEIEENKIQFIQLFEMYKEKVSESNVDVDSITQINMKWEQFTIFSDKFVEYRKKGISGDEFLKIKDEFKNSKDNLFVQIDSLLIINEKQVQQKGYDVSELVKFSTVLILIVVSVFVLVLIILRHYLLKSILKPIFQIRSATQEIAKNKLNLRINDISKDEIGELSEDINLMTHKLESVQDKLLKTEKLSIVGILAGRMAHDIRNPLAIITASLEILKLKYPDLEDVKFNKINNAVNRITHQIEDVLDFVKTSPLIIEKTSLLDILKHILDSQELSGDVNVILPQNDAIARCDSQRIRIVFLNLFLNAIDAVGKSGEIKIRFHDYKELIKIEFEDSGSGLEEKDLEHLFEPLFTTKQKGTGLGLSSVENIIKEHGGTITVTLSPTIFTIILPKTLD